jgi:hypothetical protein
MAVAQPPARLAHPSFTAASAAAVLAIGLTASAASQAALVFTSQAAFEAALTSPSSILDDYNDYTTFTVLQGTYPVDRGDYSFTTGDNMFGTNAASAATAAIDGTGFLLFGTGAAASIAFAFDNPVSALGFDFRGVNDTQGIDLSLNTTSGFSGTATTVSGVGFYGVIFDAPVTDLTLAKSATEQIGLDNLRVGTPADVAVPLPATTALLAFGLVGVFAARRPRGQAPRHAA